MKVEKYFFDYAFPCTYQKLHEQRITADEYADLERMFIANKSPSREDMERVYSSAFVFIRNLAEQMGMDVWDQEVMERFWEQEHNNIIDRGEGIYARAPQVLKDLCKTRVAEVQAITNTNDRPMIVVGFDSYTRNVFNYKVPYIKVGDRVKIHHFYAVRKVE